jgi:hypothetical protein
VDHGIAHLDAGGKAVDEDASCFAFEDGEQAAGEVGIGGVHLEGCGELAIEVVRDGDHFLLIAALDEEGCGAEDFLEQRRGFEEVGGGGGEEGWLACTYTWGLGR